MLVVNNNTVSVLKNARMGFKCFPDWHIFLRLLLLTIVTIRNWLGNPANFKGTNKDQKIYVERSTTLRNLLFCTHTLWSNYVTVTFLLDGSSGTNHDPLCLCRVMAKKSEQKHRTKNFAKLPNHLPLLTMY